MLVSEMNGLRPVDAGRQDCHDLHSWGPGVRQCYIIHYIISGNGTFTCGKKTYTLTAGQSFLICPEQVVQYAPDENEPWDYVITVCGGARETCPLFSGEVRHRLHIGFDDPDAFTGTPEEIITEFRRVRDEIRASFEQLAQAIREEES